VGDEILIHADAFKEFLTSDSNVGIRIAALCSFLTAKLTVVGLPDIVIEACEIALTMAAPLIRYSLAFGLLLACEDLRAKVKDDPDEMAALEEEASEKALRSRMNTIRVFAIDFKEAFDHGYSPDAALLAGVCMEASTSFCGMGPSTYRRLQLLMAIVNIANVEADKKAIAVVDHDLRAGAYTHTHICIYIYIQKKHTRSIHAHTNARYTNTRMLTQANTHTNTHTHTRTHILCTLTHSCTNAHTLTHTHMDRALVATIAWFNQGRGSA